MLEDFSYFALLDKGDAAVDDGQTAVQGSEPSTMETETPKQPAKSRPSRDLSQTATSLFGISCTRQIKSEKLKRRSADVTRSTVQKAVIVISPTARGMGELRERLGVVTAAWFAQEDFSDITILKEFQESLERGPAMPDDGRDHHFGLSLREMMYEFRYQTLALVKCLLLQRKMLFFGSKCERLCMMQFALISLIPGLIRNLQDSADPTLDSYGRTVERPTTLKTSERNSLLSYMGLPLHIFGKGSFFGPYTPLQQLDILADYDTKSYVVGSTNSLLLQQKERYSDILINLDESNSITITSPSLRTALSLSAADRRWIDALTQTVLDTWDPENPSRPKNMGFAGSEDAIRLQFEEYVLSLLSSMAYQVYHESMSEANVPTSVSNTEHYPDPADTASDFNPEFLAMWRETNNFALFNRLTEEHRIFDIIEPRHPTAGGLNVEDVQRRLQQTVAELHLDERVREGREQLGKTFASGKERVGAGVARFWAEVEKAREQRQTKQAQRSRDASQTRDSGGDWEMVGDTAAKGKENLDPSSSTTTTAAPPEPGTPSTSTRNPSTEASGGGGWAASLRERATKTQFQKPNVDTAQLQASARENAAKAGAYLSSWGSWAKERVQQSKTGTGGADAGGGGGGGDGAAARNDPKA
ncbi:uncharacterized protein A1O9_05752 [Exophiala aquamarina CBS 119918]|uniref:AVL9/DENND6 domain-containing protein n=1 Tax=Exophiala aquamarina CBS 119918 TaxID=1182545 RepID=A0A072PDK9_9EURO|nr:uncharacterized protein A1O9_05752 [Exophiala aquamarina CBS 119918]KEF57832.1 hypothetical protein A1O9_05752 [Exophiala aquamarina CBS 119918]